VGVQSSVSDLGANLYDRQVVESKLRKSDSIEKVGFTAQVGTIPTVFKADDEFIIWGPASVEVVDKEGDLIKADALSEALPQLLKRARLSLEHSDQLVGKILESFDAGESVKVSVDGDVFERSEFPTDVMELDGYEPALYVAGKVWNDSRQARETRRKIENGEIDSYSISGEALVTRTKIDDGDAYDQIVDMDLSAVTLCEEGMNQKSKFGTVANGSSAQKSKAIDVEQIESVAYGAIKRQMKLNKSNSSSPSTSGGLDLSKVEQKFEEVIEANLPDGELATKEDVEDTVEAVIAQKQDRASAQDDTDDEGETLYRHPDVENPFDREFSPAVVERMAKEIIDQVGDVYGLSKKTYSHDVLKLASEYDMTPAQIERIRRGEDEDHDDDDEMEREDDEMEDYEEMDEMEEGMERQDDEMREQELLDTTQLEEVLDEIEEDKKEAIMRAMEDEEDDEDDEMMMQADDEMEDYEEMDEMEEGMNGHSDDEMEDYEEMEMADDEMEDYEEMDEEEEMNYSAKELERQLPSDVFNVVSEFIETSASAKSTRKSDREGEIEQAVEEVLKGKGLTKSDGANSSGAAVGSAPEPSFEKGQSDDSASAHPALANIYSRE
jgi:hypothetical protein